MSNPFGDQDSLALEIEADEAMVAQLPEDSKLVSTTGHGASLWTRSARVDTILADGVPKAYFLKVAAGENGRSMMQGEYESAKALNAVVSNFAPRPVGWGTFKSNPDLHFFLQDFHEMDGEVPDMEKLTFKLAEMHLKSTDLHIKMKSEYEKSGGDKFGFHVTTHNGSLAQDNSWVDTWEEFYIQGMKRMLDLEEKARGPQPEEMTSLLTPLFEKVIPRLLRPMETGGRRIKPSLLHGDLWHGNTSTDIETDEPIVYDSCAFWGHNEFDLRTMRAKTRFKFGRAWLKAYLEHYPATPPVEDFEYRNALYILQVARDTLRMKVKD
ncbi:MAG: hypothetical protein M1839_006696 [Geoglossum umbratile]|nr:MAG: hypothetical protein M1839_006696 [Geoglossum umbratile]